MIQPNKESARIITARNQASFNTRSRIVDQIEAAVDRRQLRRVYCDHSRVIPAGLFEVCKDETPLASYRPRYTQAILPLREVVFLTRHRISRIEALVSKEAVCSSVPRVSSGLGQDVDHT